MKGMREWFGLGPAEEAAKIPAACGPLTAPEQRVVQLLAEAYIAFSELEAYHPADEGDFVDCVHRAQHIVMARLAVRQHPELFHREPPG